MPKRITVILSFFTVSTIFLTLIAVASPSFGFQSTQISPIFVGDEVKSVSWSLNNQSIVFYEGGDIPLKELPSDSSQGRWWKYDVSSNTLTAQYVWPLEPILTNSERQQLHILKNTFTLKSPNSRYLIYVETQTDTDTDRIVLRDQQLQQQYILSRRATPLFLGGSDSFSVLWSGDDSHFILKTTVDEFTTLTYYTLDLKTLANTKSTPIDKLNIVNDEYVLADAYSLSYDGKVALVMAKKKDSITSDLVLLNLGSIFSGKILQSVKSGTTISAGFVSGNSQRASILTKDSLLQIDTASDKVTSLIKLLETVNGQEAVFSPDGKKAVVIYTADNKSSSKVFLLDIVTGTMLRITPRKVATATLKPQALLLSAECSPSPKEYRIWKIINVNAYDVSLSWEILDSIPQKVGKLTIPAAVNNHPGEVILKTNVVKEPDNIVIYLGDGQEQSKSSSSAQCLTPTISK